MYELTAIVGDDYYRITLDSPCDAISAFGLVKQLCMQLDGDCCITVTDCKAGEVVHEFTACARNRYLS